MKTKIIAVWHVEYCHALANNMPLVDVAESYADARRVARYWARWPGEYTDISITGPHQHRVPA